MPLPLITFALHHIKIPRLKRWLEGEQQVQMSEAERRRLEKKQRKEDLQQRRYGNRR